MAFSVAGTKARWAGVSPEDRKAAMAVALAARIRSQREKRIADLIASAPPLTVEQKARLAALLNAHPEAA